MTTRPCLWCLYLQLCRKCQVMRVLTGPLIEENCIVLVYGFKVCNVCGDKCYIWSFNLLNIVKNFYMGVTFMTSITMTKHQDCQLLHDLKQLCLANFYWISQLWSLFHVALIAMLLHHILKRWLISF